MSSSAQFMLAAALLFATFSIVSPALQHQLSPTFYDETCPDLVTIVRDIIRDAMESDPRTAASLIRLHFHDCFVQGCDGSVLLDNSPTIESEKDAGPNKKSARGFDVIDRIKREVEWVCPATVSCADILTVAAEESVYLSGGPPWTNLLGRRDCTTVNKSLVSLAIPSPVDTFDQLKNKFSTVGLDNRRDLVALSGAHTLGKAHCAIFSHRLYNFSNTGAPDLSLDETYLENLQKLCPQQSKQNLLVDFDHRTPYFFDKNYFTNLLNGEVLLQSDQELLSTKDVETIVLIKKYSKNTKTFFKSFVKSMIKMGNIGVLTETRGEIRLNCRMINWDFHQSQSNN